MERCFDRSLRAESQLMACDGALSILVEPESRAAVLAERAVILAAEDDYAEARADIRAALSLAPDLTDVKVAAGWVLLAEGQSDRAVETLAQAHEADPDHPRALVDYMDILAETGQPERCLDLVPQAHEIAADDPWTYGVEARCLTDLGRDEEALRSYDRAIAMGLEDASLQSNRSVSLINLGRYAEAEANAREAIGLEPDYGLAHYNLVDALLRQDRVPDAIAAYEHARSLGVGLRENLADFTAWTLYQKGDYEDGLAIIEEYLASGPALPGPGDASEIDTHAHLLAALGRSTEAVNEFQRAIAIDGEARIALYEEKLAGLGFDLSGGLRAALKACVATGPACVLY